MKRIRPISVERAQIEVTIVLPQEVRIFSSEIRIGKKHEP